MAFIGSVMSMSISIVLPCVFALKLGVLPSRMGALAACFVAAFGVVAGCVSTYEVCGLQLPGTCRNRATLAYMSAYSTA